MSQSSVLYISFSKYIGNVIFHKNDGGVTITAENNIQIALSPMSKLQRMKKKNSITNMIVPKNQFIDQDIYNFR
jgi:hypothetical protein